MESSGKGSGAGTAEEKSSIRAVWGKLVSASAAASSWGGLPEVTCPGALPRGARRVALAMFPVTRPSGVPLSRTGSPHPPPWLRRSLAFASHPFTSAMLQCSSPCSPLPHLLLCLPALLAPTSALTTSIRPPLPLQPCFPQTSILFSQIQTLPSFSCAAPPWRKVCRDYRSSAAP